VTPIERLPFTAHTTGSDRHVGIESPNAAGNYNWRGDWHFDTEGLDIPANRTEARAIVSATPNEDLP